MTLSTLNKVHRIDSCLQRLSQQSYEIRGFLVIDIYSSDGIRDRVKQVISCLFNRLSALEHCIQNF
ncbi:glycosyltransferase family A protein [cyanobacterium endosymbiont of Rhopalodia gibberula]|uniref:glycosyltransferase family A protein n=1 Tax=cyanobacterium endosymbiont of Rhopalodia gibberula TaxID=1763363 RepID=UPI0011AB676C|nr:glycosyltransferase family A protein [cyanobacterium endosymbiont of Rhopalodia gibberula]